MSDWDDFREEVQAFHDEFDFPDVILHSWVSEYDPATGRSTDTHSTDTVAAEISRTQAPTTTNDARGEDVEVDVTIRFRSDATELPINDAGSDAVRPSEFEVDGARYTIVASYDEGNGLFVCEGTR